MDFKKGDIFMTDEEKLSVAIAEAHLGLSEGGIPIGAALFDEDGRLLGSGHNLRVQEGDASMHGETSVSQGHLGNQPLPLLVLLRIDSSVRHWPSFGWR
jgi:tRNA(Arg) A34 adenosine deaminase TadA